MVSFVLAWYLRSRCFLQCRSILAARRTQASPGTPKTSRRKEHDENQVVHSFVAVGDGSAALFCGTFFCTDWNLRIVRSAGATGVRAAGLPRGRLHLDAGILGLCG